MLLINFDKMPTIAYSVNIDSERFLDPVGLSLVEPQLWREGLTEGRYSRISQLQSSGRVVESLHLRNYRNEDSFAADLDEIRKRLPAVRRVVTHTPKIRYVGGESKREDAYRGYLGMVNIAVSQTGLPVGIEHTHGGVLSDVSHIRYMKRLVEDYGQKQIGFVVDSSHIPLTNNRDRNTEVLLEFIEAAGERLLEVQISEGKHRKLDGRLFNWEKIMAELPHTPLVLEMINLGQVEESVAYLKRLGLLA